MEDIEGSDKITKIDGSLLFNIKKIKDLQARTLNSDTRKRTYKTPKSMIIQEKHLDYPICKKIFFLPVLEKR